MSVEVRVPALGESIVEATVGTWHKQVGQAVAGGEALVDLETDKVNLEITAAQDGVLEQILKHTGANVAVGELLGTLGAAGTPAQNGTAIAAQPGAAASSPAADRDTRATPVARRMAEEQGRDLRSVAGSGPGGRVTKDDLAAPAPAPSARPAAPAAPPAALLPGADPAREQRVRLSRRRQTIAQRLVEAQHTAAMLTTFNEIDMSAIIALRTRHKDTFKQRNGVGLGFMSFFTKAVIGALKAFPMLNAEIQGSEIVLKHYYDIGIAVGAEEGLVVPVLRDADRKSFAQIEREISDLAGRARDGTLTLAELQGGTFTITNGGVFGSLMSTPILNAPQVGILGMHKIQERPIALNGAVAIRPMMYVALSYDHRIVDGSTAVRYLVRIKELAEDPEALLLEG